MTHPGGEGARALAKDLCVRALWPPTLVFLVYVTACALGVTRKVPGIDMVFHLAGGLAIAFCFARSLEILNSRGFTNGIDGLARLIVILALTATAALFWEFAEFAVDMLLGTRFQTDLPDTMSDLALGLLGGIMFLALPGRARA